MIACGGAAAVKFHDFLEPAALREPRRIWRVGRVEQFLTPDSIYDQFQRTPDGQSGFWLVNLGSQKRLVAVSVVCTHLGCVVNWMSAESKFKCPCHGSGFSLSGVNTEGPAPGRWIDWASGRIRRASSLLTRAGSSEVRRSGMIRAVLL